MSIGVYVIPSGLIQSCVLYLRKQDQVTPYIYGISATQQCVTLFIRIGQRNASCTMLPYSTTSLIRYDQRTLCGTVKYKKQLYERLHQLVIYAFGGYVQISNQSFVFSSNALRSIHVDGIQNVKINQTQQAQLHSVTVASLEYPCFTVNCSHEGHIIYSDGQISVVSDTPVSSGYIAQIHIKESKTSTAFTSIPVRNKHLLITNTLSSDLRVATKQNNTIMITGAADV